MRLVAAIAVVVLTGCPQSLAGLGTAAEQGDGLPPNRDVLRDAGAPDAGQGLDDDAGPPPPPPPGDAGPAPDAGDPGAACVTWQDCPPWLGDPSSGFACVDGQCACDPEGTLSEGCGQAGGFWNAGTCYCDLLDEDEPAACNVWQDCPPHYESTQSGYECIAQQCTCDPDGTYQGNCATQGGYWVAPECFCAFNDDGPPGYDPEPDCWWHLEEPLCDPDRWVDTSHYETECGYQNDEYVCENVWVSSGYYEDGACPPPYWEQRCYG